MCKLCQYYSILSVMQLMLGEKGIAACPLGNTNKMLPKSKFFLRSVVPIITLFCDFKVEQGNRLGSVCQYKDQCSDNEICRLRNQMMPPCLTGICHCQNGFDLIEDCSQFSSQCMPIRPRLGEDCCENDRTLIASPVVYPPGAHCKNGQVECRPNFELTGSICARMKPKPRVKRKRSNQPIVHSACASHDDCPPGSVCRNVTAVSNLTACQCLHQAARYDPKRDMCSLREFGDACLANRDCNALTKTNWMGYTVKNGICLLGFCACSTSDTTQVFVSYLDRGSYARILNKTICVASEGAVVNLPVGSDCNLDPIYDGQTSGVRICAAGLVCFSCPESSDDIMGKCRMLYKVEEETPVTLYLGPFLSSATNSASIAATLTESSKFHLSLTLLTLTNFLIGLKLN